MYNTNMCCVKRFLVPVFSYSSLSSDVSVSMVELLYNLVIQSSDFVTGCQLQRQQKAEQSIEVIDFKAVSLIDVSPKPIYTIMYRSVPFCTLQFPVDF